MTPQQSESRQSGWSVVDSSVDRLIGDQLRENYEEIIDEPMPEPFLELLRRIGEIAPHGSLRAVEATVTRDEDAPGTVVLAV